LVGSGAWHPRSDFPVPPFLEVYCVAPSAVHFPASQGFFFPTPYEFRSFTRCSFWFPPFGPFFSDVRERYGESLTIFLYLPSKGPCRDNTVRGAFDGSSPLFFFFHTLSWNSLTASCHRGIISYFGALAVFSSPPSSRWSLTEPSFTACSKSKNLAHWPDVLFRSSKSVSLAKEIVGTSTSFFREIYNLF